MSPGSRPPLCLVDDATFWVWRRWPEFKSLAQRRSAVIVIPVVGLADWGPDYPLEAEERVLLSVLRPAVRKTPDVLVLPPLRFVAGPVERCVFAVDVPTAHAFIAEVTGSVVASGFRRIVLFNASPWNEELVAAAARDLRLALGVQMFTVQLSALGLDFLSSRTPDRTRLQAVLQGQGDPAAEQLLCDLLCEIQHHPAPGEKQRTTPTNP